MLNTEDIKMLRQPFHKLSVKWLPVSKTSNNTIMMMPYLDASLIVERLNIVDPCWEETTIPIAASPDDPLGLNSFLPMQCTLTIKGVSRTGIGQLSNNKKDDKHAKSSESDALKRAALKFGIGAYLRALPMIFMPIPDNAILKNDGKIRGITKKGKEYCRAEYEGIITHKLFANHYGQATDYGESIIIDEDQQISNDEEVNKLDLQIIAELSKKTRTKPYSTDEVQLMLGKDTYENIINKQIKSLKEYCNPNRSTINQITKYTQNKNIISLVEILNHLENQS